MINNEITWVECDGGPHILMESKYLKIWKGDTDEEYENAKGYYEETGLIDDYIGELNSGLGKCLVISEDIASSTGVSVNNTGGYLVVVNYLSDFYINEGLKCEILYNEFRKIAEDQFVDTGIIYFEMFLKRLELLRNIS